MTTPARAPGRALLHGGLAAVVFVLLAPLTLRHVGESVFLVDQADQLQFFERFLRLEPTGWWGPMMTSPDPPTHAIGPLTNWMFGVPVALGFTVDATQAITSLLLVLATLAAFVALARIDLRFGWAWLLIFLANGIVWWNAGILWSNTLLLPAGALMLAAMAMCLQTPTIARLLVVLLAVVFAAHAHLVAITGLAPAAVVALRTWRRAWAHPPRGAAAAVLALALAAAVGPYMVAEAIAGFANTRAILSHAGGQAPTAIPPSDYARAVLEQAADPAWVLRRAAITGTAAIGVGVAVALGALLIGGWWTRRARDDERHAAMFWLVLAALAGIAFQVAFFVSQKRGLDSYHYVAMLVPLYAVPPAALAAWTLALAPARVRDLAAAALAAACLVFVWRQGESWADRYFEPTDWTFTRITVAVDELCSASGAARVAEGPAFDSVVAGHDGVLTYLMTRRHVRCRLDPASDRLIAASREGGYEEVRQEPDAVFRLVRVVDPGIALYRRDGGAPNQ